LPIEREGLGIQHAVARGQRNRPRVLRLIAPAIAESRKGAVVRSTATTAALTALKAAATATATAAASSASTARSAPTRSSATSTPGRPECCAPQPVAEAILPPRGAEAVEPQGIAADLRARAERRHLGQTSRTAAARPSRSESAPSCDSITARLLVGSL